jgi:uncharacterized repeat protein (TIGR01451 family)/CSLREA domain-containing protein
MVALPAYPASILVTEFDDVFDDTDGTCTLREAVRSLNTGADLDACQTVGNGDVEIRLAAGTYRLDLANGTAEDASIDGDLDILNVISIRGVSAQYSIIDGDAASSQERVFDVFDNRLQLTNLTVTGGNEPLEAGGNIRVNENGDLVLADVIVSNGKAAGGGGIAGGSSVSLTRSVIRDNEALGEDGLAGGIAAVNGTELVVRHSTISNNRAAVGGGIFAIGQSLRILDSRITGNVASRTGGGLAIVTGAAFMMSRTLVADNQADQGAGVFWDGEVNSEITHSAIINNTATENGGGIYSAVDGFIRYSTISGNSAASGGGVYSVAGMTLLDSVTLAGNTGGGGLFNESGATIEYSLLAGNTGGNCLGTPPLANAYNLDDENTCAFPTDDPDKPSFVNTDPMIGPLQDNGGGLPTHALLAGSPAIDAYNSVDRTNCHETPDQRAYSRGNPPVLGDGSDADHLCDIGAYEFNLPFVVNSTDDTIDDDFADGVCADVNGNCTLRAAVMQSDSVPFFNEIELGAGTYALTLAGADEDLSLSGDLDIEDDVLIRGRGAEETIIDGAGLDRIIGRPLILELSMPPRANLIRLQDLTLQGGVADLGGAILGWKPLELERVALRDNYASLRGGAVHCADDCELSIVDSTVDGNESVGNGAISYSAERALLLDGTTISNNVGGTGGAIGIAGTLHARNSTFSGNTGDSSAVAFATAIILENTTVTDNEADFENGSFRIFDPSVIVNSIIANNRVGGDVKNCTIDTTAIVSLGHNVTDTEAADCNLTHPSDLVETDPLLGPLADNGGPTLTHLPLAGSPAIDAGDNDRCTATDQRGTTRTDDCDIGSVEASSADVAVAISAAPSPVVQGSNTTLTVTVSNNGPADAAGVTAITTLPAAMGFVSGTASSAGCTDASGVVTCELGDVANGSSATASIVVSANQTGTVTVPVEISMSSADSDAANNSAETSVTINAPAGGGGGGGGGGGSLGLFSLIVLLLGLAWRGRPWPALSAPRFWVGRGDSGARSECGL